MAIDRLIVDPDRVPVYIPPRHTLTRNRRLIGQELGARHIEVVLGEIMPGGEAELHSHPQNEQAVYILSGQCLVTCLGESRVVGSSQAIFFPAGVEHRVQCLGRETLRLLIVYSPPLNGTKN